jgi:stearoyl-CoA desaturase (Delta-9 desaturase)
MTLEPVNTRATMALTLKWKDALRLWIDVSASAAPKQVQSAPAERIQWLRVLPFLLLHVACFAVIWVGVSPVALWVALAAYVVRMFAVTAFYHRYFSHRSFKTSRAAQLIFAILGASAVQRGPLWWAAHHRHHHAHADLPPDPHSPTQHGFWRAHVGWFLSAKCFIPDMSRVRDLSCYPELRWLDRFDVAVPIALAVSMFALGWMLERSMPQLQTSGWQMLVWGFFISTVACYHVTYSINSLCHGFGRRRYATRDDSRNNWLLALLTFGEGWHNNHHHYPKSARQGFYWWEADLTYYGLKLLALFGVIWDLKPVPAQVRASGRALPR